MKKLEPDKKLKFWQIIVLIELILIITLGVYANQLVGTINLQRTFIVGLKDAVQVKEERIQLLSTRLVSAMAVLQKAAEEIRKESIVPPAEVPAP
jgi:hypothetical protein